MPLTDFFLTGPLADDPLYAAYLLAFGAAALGCFASLTRVARITDPDTRRGLQALLVTSGAWAGAHVGYLAAPSVTLKLDFYLAGLIVGFATVGPWLYFCSAYTGRSLHRNRRVQQVAVVLFLLVVAVKTTNPIHGYYYSASFVSTPFPHVAIHSTVLHWTVMGLSYALAAVGYFMLLELFVQVDSETRPLALLVALTGLPVLVDIVALASPTLLAIPYEPLGVAAFSIGVAFVSLDRFESVQLAAGRDEPVIVLDEGDEIRDYNSAAGRLFPALAGGLGEPLANLLPDVDAALDEHEPILSFDLPDGTRYYRLSTNPFSADRSRIGRLLVFADVTHREQYRRELERQNERLEQFASLVSHDLRNPLMVALARIDVLADAERDGGPGESAAVAEHLATARTALERMEALIDDLLALARQGQPVDDPEPVALDAVAGRAWEMVDAGGTALAVETARTVRADPDRLQQLFENCYRNAREHGDAETVTVGWLADGDGFFVADDGRGIPESEREEVLEFGYTTNENGTGFGLAIVGEVADAHGWNLAVAESDAGGAQLEFRGVESV